MVDIARFMNPNNDPKPTDLEVLRRRLRSAALEIQSACQRIIAATPNPELDAVIVSIEIDCTGRGRLITQRYADSTATTTKLDINDIAEFVKVAMTENEAGEL